MLRDTALTPRLSGRLAPTLRVHAPEQHRSTDTPERRAIHWMAPTTLLSSAATATPGSRSPEALYNTNNTTATTRTGMARRTTYTAPFTLWETATQAAVQLRPQHDRRSARRVAVHQGLLVAVQRCGRPTTEAAYTPRCNTVSGSTDGWDATKVYTEPYTFHERLDQLISRTEHGEILQQLIAPAEWCRPIRGRPVHQRRRGHLLRAAQWTQFAGAMTSMALAECGGTVTLQTKVGSAAARRPVHVPELGRQDDGHDQLAVPQRHLRLRPRRRRQLDTSRSACSTPATSPATTRWDGAVSPAAPTTRSRRHRCCRADGRTSP